MHLFTAPKRTVLTNFFFQGNVSLATAVVTDESTPKTRGRGMALIGIAFSVGFIVGPIIGAAFSIWGKEREGAWFAYPAGFALTLALAQLVYLYLFFEETLPEGQRLRTLGEAVSQAAVYVNPVSLFRFASIRNLTPHDERSLRTLGLVYFLYLFLYSGLEFTLTFLTHLRFGFTSMQQGWFGKEDACRAILVKLDCFDCAICRQDVPVCGHFDGAGAGRIYSADSPGKGEDRRSQVSFFFLNKKSQVITKLLISRNSRGLILIIPSFAIIGFAYNLWTLYAGLALYALSTSVCVPCMTTVVSTYGDASQKGIVTGVFR